MSPGLSLKLNWSCGQAQNAFGILSYHLSLQDTTASQKATEKYLAIHPLQRYNTQNLNMKKSPSGQAAAADAAPGQEGLFDHMFDHRQLRNTRKQWS